MKVSIVTSCLLIILAFAGCAYQYIRRQSDNWVSLIPKMLVLGIVTATALAAVVVVFILEAVAQ